MAWGHFSPFKNCLRAFEECLRAFQRNLSDIAEGYMINVLHTVYWEISLLCCIVTRACGTRDNTGNRLVIFPSTECIIYIDRAACCNRKRSPMVKHMYEWWSLYNLLLNWFLKLLISIVYMYSRNRCCVLVHMYNIMFAGGRGRGGDISDSPAGGGAVCVLRHLCLRNELSINCSILVCGCGSVVAFRWHSVIGWTFSR